MSYEQQQDFYHFKKDRQNFVVQLRKKNRNNIFNNKRQCNKYQQQQQLVIGQLEGKETAKRMMIVDQSLRQQIQGFMWELFFQEQIQELCHQLQTSTCVIKKHRALIGIRKLVSQKESLPSMNVVINSNLIQTLIVLIKQSKYSQMQLQACWILTNMCSGAHELCQKVVSKQSIDAFIEIIKQNKKGVTDQAVWALGNIAGDCYQFRDIIIQRGGVQTLCGLINNTTSISTIRQGTWALSNLCRNSPLPPYQKVQQAIPIMAKVIISGVLDHQSIYDTLWALSYLSQGSKTKIQKLIDTGIVPKLTQFLLQQPYLQTIISSMRILGNMTNGNEQQTNAVLDNKGLTVLSKLLRHQRKSIRREACWMLSNISAGTQVQVKKVCEELQIMQQVASLFAIDQEDVKCQICYIYGNMTYLGNQHTVYHVIKQYHVLEQLIINLDAQSCVKSINASLQAIYGLLSLGDTIKNQLGQNSLIRQLANIPQALQKLQQLQHHSSTQVYQKLFKIFTRYFNNVDHL